MMRIALLLILSALFFISCQQRVTVTTSATVTVPDTAIANSAVPVIDDTVTIGGQLYDIVAATEQEFDRFPIVGPYKEEETIRQDSMRVSRAGDSLIFLLANGRQKMLIDNRNSEGDDHVEHSFRMYHPVLQQWVISSVSYKYFAHLLINPLNGEVTELVNFPEVSPDKKYFICTNADLKTSYHYNGFQLFQLSPFIKLLDQRELKNWGASSMKWDGKTLLARQHYLNTYSREYVRYVRLGPR